MKKIKVLSKIFIVLFLIFLMFYGGLYLYAHLFSKLEINSSNGYYIYDSNEVLINATTDQWITLDNTSNFLIQATLAIEDKNFYKHTGFDYLRIGTATESSGAEDIM